LYEDYQALPQAVKDRMWAVRTATNFLSLMKPRMHVEQAADEVFRMAEALLDDLHGVRDARLQTMSYAEYLRTPEWDEKRRAAYRKADYRCQLCDASGTELHAHHRSYARRAREREEGDLIVLCANCHKRVHEFIWKVT
jgi:hypothetical protein